MRTPVLHHGGCLPSWARGGEWAWGRHFKQTVWTRQPRSLPREVGEPHFSYRGRRHRTVKRLGQDLTASRMRSRGFPALASGNVPLPSRTTCTQEGGGGSSLRTGEKNMICSYAIGAGDASLWRASSTLKTLHVFPICGSKTIMKNYRQLTRASGSFPISPRSPIRTEQLLKCFSVIKGFVRGCREGASVYTQRLWGNVTKRVGGVPAEEGFLASRKGENPLLRLKMQDGHGWKWFSAQT